MFKTLKSMAWFIGVLFVIFFIGMYFFVKTAFEVWEPPPQGYSRKELLHSRNAQLFGVGNEQEWKLTSPTFSQTALHLGENNLIFEIHSEQSLDITKAKIILRLERPASLKKSQKLEFWADESQLPSKQIKIKGKLIVPEGGRWELSSFAVINDEAGVHRVGLFDTKGQAAK